MTEGKGHQGPFAQCLLLALTLATVCSLLMVVFSILEVPVVVPKSKGATNVCPPSPYQPCWLDGGECPRPKAKGHFLALIAYFRQETMIMCEWLDHYLWQVGGYSSSSTHREHLV